MINSTTASAPANAFMRYTTRGERRVINRLIDHILAGGNVISVEDGEEWVIKLSDNKRAIQDVLATTDSDFIRVRNPETKEILGSFLIIYGNAPDGTEIIADHTDNAYCNTAYNAATK